MINPYTIEKKTQDYLQKIQAHVLKLQKQVCFYMFQKQQQTKIPIPQHIRDECQIILYGQRNKKEFQCKICGEVFDDGRKLGGHNSKKHKKTKSVKFLQENQKMDQEKPLLKLQQKTSNKNKVYILKQQRQYLSQKVISTNNEV